MQPELISSLRTDDAAVRRYLTQGWAYYYLQEFARSDDSLEKAEQLARTKSASLRSEVAISRGTIFSFQHNYPEALAQYRKGLELAKANHDSYWEANALGGLGLAYMNQEHFDEAIDWFEAAMKLPSVQQNPPLEAVTLGNLGWCYYKLGDFDRAADLMNQANVIFQQSDMLRQQAIWLNDLGLVRYAQGDNVAAKEHFNRALTIARQLGNKAAIALYLNNLAMVAIDLQQFDDAERFNSEALALNHANGDRSDELLSLHKSAEIAAGRGEFRESETLLKEVIRESANDPSLHWIAEVTIADIYAKQKHDGAADREFRSALATIDQARDSVAKEEYRLSFLNSTALFYNNYIDFLVTHGRASDGLRIVEHSRAHTLAEGLGLKSASLNSTRPPEQASRDFGAVILEYWLKPGQSYLWVVTPFKVTLFKLPPITEIEATVQEYRKALLGPHDPLETGNRAGLKLYNILVAPAQKLIRPGARVVISAEDALSNLNFETLIVPTPKPHYWIDDVILSDAASLALLQGSKSRSHSAEKRLLLVGDPLSASPEYPRLPQAATEIDRVEHHFPAKSRLVLEGSQATPQAYLASDTGRFSYVHFVAHGTASRTTPLESAVILSPQGDSYKLYARDIVTKPLHADLVTISTCYGAGSRAYTGEGLVGLSWAFLRAGAHNTIAALWEVNDASTAQLMDQLYAGIDKGRDPAVALRAAKLAMLHSDGIYRRPFYWAPFQLYQGSSGAEPQVSARSPSGDD